MISNRIPRLLIAVALVLFALRFAGLGLAPFILDEPMLQLRLDEHFRAGTLPTFGLRGTHGVDYGPTALWLYAPVRLITSSVPAIIAVHALYLGLGWALIYLAVRRRIGTPAAAWALALAASSPYLFFYSRTAWDNTFQVFTTGVIVYLIARLTRERSHLGLATALGAACGLTFGVHLMSLPVLAAAAWVLARERGSARLDRAAARVACLGVGFSVVVAPYLPVVLPQLAHGEGGHFGITLEGLLHTLPRTFIATGRYLSAFKIQYFFEGAMPDPLRILSYVDPAWVLRLAGWAWLVMALVRVARRQAIDPVTRLAALSFALLLAYYFGVRPDMYHPHYVMPTAWILFVAAGGAIQGAQGTLKRTLQAFGFATIFMNVAFVLASASVIAERHGLRSEHYGPVNSELLRTAREACEMTSKRGRQAVSIDLGGTPGVFGPSIQYLFAHEAACRGLVLAWKGGGMSSQSLPAGAATLALGTRFADSPSKSAQLTLVERP